MRKWMLSGQCLVVAGSVLALSVVQGCWPPGDDDDDDTTAPVDVTPTPDDWDTETPLPPKVTVSGTVTAVDRTSGEELTPEEYSSRAGAIVVYALVDPADLVHPLSKATLAGPGYYEMEVPEDVGQVYVVAIADWDFNTVITNSDVYREADLSPVSVGLEPVGDVDVTMDLGVHAGGGPSPGSGPFAGTVVYDAEDAEDTNIAVVAFLGDYSSHTFGMSTQTGPGDYSVDVGLYGETTALVGYADADRNGLYEPSDPAGLAEENPYVLSAEGRAGVNILIEGVGPGGLPSPIPYITVAGTVSADDAYQNSTIEVSIGTADGSIRYGATTLDGPGEFSLRVPGMLSNVVVSAWTDSNGDGFYSEANDASATYGPFDAGTSNIGGVSLVLITPEEPTTGISGSILYSGSYSDADQLVLAIFDSPDTENGPVWVSTRDIGAGFPVEYEAVGLESILEAQSATSMTIYLGVILDVGSNYSEGPGASDLIGFYSTDGVSATGVTLEDHVVLTGIQMVIQAAE